MDDPADCRCQKTEFKLKWCACGRSKPSNESSADAKIRFWIDTEKIRNGIPYNSLEIPEHAKTSRDRDPEYQAFVRGLQELAKQINPHKYVEKDKKWFHSQLRIIRIFELFIIIYPKR